MQIPQINLKPGTEEQRQELTSAIQRVVESGWYILGHEVESFELSFASYCGAKHAIGVASGTDALEIALRAFNIGPGDAVVTVSHTAGATVAGIERAGAAPILVDVDSKTYTMNLDHLEDCLKKHPLKDNIRAIVPVHLYGFPVDIQAINELSEGLGIAVIEDCAQAHGAERQGKKVGSIGHYGAFSFYPTKNLGAIGDAGILITDDDQLAEYARMIRQYGWKNRFMSEVKGVNSRLDEIQAAILSVRLTRLEEANARRVEIANAYTAELRELDLVLPDGNGSEVKHVYHQYVIRTKHRDALMRYLLERGIGTAIHYPRPVHLQPVYKNRIAIHGDCLPNTDALIPEILSLPLFPELSENEVTCVVEVIREFFLK